MTTRHQFVGSAWIAHGPLAPKWSLLRAHALGRGAGVRRRHAQLGVAIFVVVVVNGVSRSQENRAEHAAERLAILPGTVVREAGEIDAAELVVDDLVLLEAGDRVSADLRVLEAPRSAWTRRC